MATCWKAAVILAGILILCSCRAVPPAELAVTENIISGGGPYTTADLPPSATTGLNAPCRTWSPPGIAGPWPKDEYICDGGERDRPVKIDTDWTVKGLHLEDTVAHYDTLDGQTLVAPSNRVCVYAPRFGSVRLVLGVDGFEGKDSLIRHEVPCGQRQKKNDSVPIRRSNSCRRSVPSGSKRSSTQQRNSPSLLLAGDTGVIEADGGLKTV